MIINTVEALTKLIQECKKEGNLLYPLSFIDSIKQMHRVSVRKIQVNTDPASMEIYHPKQTPSGQFALTKNSLVKLDLAAGISWVSTRRADDRKIQHLCAMEAVGRLVDLDGSPREIVGYAELDYRDGSPQIEGLTGGDIRQRRSAIVQRAETAAKNRARREALGLKATYSMAELARPFIVLKLVDDLPSKYEEAYVASLLGLNQVFGAPTVETIEPELPPEAQGEAAPPPEPETKEDMIAAINRLYIDKLGGPRPANRAPLNDLSVEQLTEVRQTLLAMENHARA